LLPEIIKELNGIALSESSEETLSAIAPFGAKRNKDDREFSDAGSGRGKRAKKLSRKAKEGNLF